MKKLILCLALLVALSQSGAAQSGAPAVAVQASPTVLNSCTAQHSDAAANTLVTITLTPPSGQYVYVCGWDWTASQNATASVAQTLTKWTATNMGPAGFTMFSMYSLAATNNLVASNEHLYQSAPAKSTQQGVAVLFSSPAATANLAYSLNVYYYFAP